MDNVEKQIARETLERYSGSPADDFQKSLLLTNFPKYVDYFAKSRSVEKHEGSVFTAAHCKKDQVSILNFSIGSPAAALVIDICSHLPIQTSLLLGMCGGLRRSYKIGDYLVPIASIRAEATSDYYFPPDIPALANFLMQKAVTEVMENQKHSYHVGITYTTNIRFWEFNEEMKNRLIISRAQGVEMECATLFIASYKKKFNLGALLLISDLPLIQAKTKKSSESIFQNYTKDHVEKGIEILKVSRRMQKEKVKGLYIREELQE